MGSWDFIQYGATETSGDRELLEQVFNCFNIKTDYDDLHGSEAGIIYQEFNPDIIGNATNATIDIEELYYVLNSIFENTVVFYEKEEGSNTSDYYYREEKIYNPMTGEMKYGEKEYCYGDGTVFGVSPYECFIEEIEDLASERGIEVSWDIRTDEWTDEEYYEPNQNNKEFSDLCEEVLAGRSLEDLGTHKYSLERKIKQPSESTMLFLESEAKKRGYVDLIRIINEKTQ